MIAENVNDEYLCVVRTNSIADFFTKPSSSSSSPTLNPTQETIESILESSLYLNHLKPLFFNYFKISAEASSFCTFLLGSIHKLIESIDLDHTSSEQTMIILNDHPFSDINKQHFKHIHDIHTSVLHQLKSKSKRLTTIMKMIKFFNMEYGFVREVVEQLDMAAKGAYILNRDFDTIGRLVGRIQDEIEHDRVVMEFCLERKEERHYLQMLKEMKKNEYGVRKKAKELEEHVYLCLVTINRARTMVVREICKNSIDKT